MRACCAGVLANGVGLCPNMQVVNLIHSPDGVVAHGVQVIPCSLEARQQLRDAINVPVVFNLPGVSHSLAVASRGGRG